MRLVKGAGLVELLGLAPVVERDGYRGCKTTSLNIFGKGGKLAGRLILGI